MRAIRFFAALMLLCVALPVCSAQESVPFEGEIVYETYENYSDFLTKMPNSINVNGVHKIRLIVKGDMLHVINETTGCHTIVNNASARSIMNGQKNNEARAYVHFCDYTKTGLDMSDAPGVNYILSNGDIAYADGSKAPLTTNTFVKTEDSRNIMGENCFLYAGQMVRNMGGMNQTYDIKTWVSDNLLSSEGYKWNLFGLDIPGIAMKWTMKYDGGHVSVMNVGELSFYIEADVIEVKPRTVSDEEFNIPSDYKITTGATGNAMKTMNYYKSIQKELKKRGIKGGDNSQKTTGVHYKTNNEWDF